MLDDTATSSAVTSSRDSDVTQTNDVIDDVPAVSNDSDVSSMCDTDTTSEPVDVTSTSSVMSLAAASRPTDAMSVDKSTAGHRSECRVCSDDAAGMYFGALVCVPCKVRAA